VEIFTRLNYLELRPALICIYIKYSRTRQIKEGMHKVIPLLVDLGADVNGGVCLYTGNTALHDAAQIGFIEKVSVLLKYHANAEIKNKHGLRAVELATEHSIIVLLGGETRETLEQYDQDNKICTIM